MLEQFFWMGGAPSLLVLGVYDLQLVALSVLIAILICSVAMQIAGIARELRDARYRHLAVVTGSLALGVGIWSMHFIGMLAFSLCAPVRYDTFLTAASIVPAVLASWIALEMLAREHAERFQLFAGGALVGGGIGAMHYVGMAAMEMAPLLRYDPWWFAASLVVSVLLAWFALWLRFGLRQHGRYGKQIITLLSGTVLGAAVAAMHYVAMSAARFVGEGDPAYVQALDLRLILIITGVTLVLAAAVLGGNLLLRFHMLYKQLRLSESYQKAIFATAVDGVITIDPRGTMLSVNPSVTRLFGWQPGDLIGQNVTMLMSEPNRTLHAQYLENYLGGGQAKVIGIGRETTARRADGSEFPIRLAVGEVRVDEQLFFVGFITDISEQKRVEALLEREATQDALTGLANRRQLSILLPRAIGRTYRYADPMAVIFIDLDGFKQVNDTLGHEAGDELLKVVAHRLQELVRRTDMVVRLAGDEFVIVFEGLKQEGDAERLAEKVLAEICVPMTLGENTARVGASLGVAIYRPSCALSADSLLQKADEAMYRAKKAGKGRIVVIDL
ncbi:MAG: diguanylate cyclase [Candidatus Dactylopiibacterium sp.]|nr:diguanylate cyclase [Candidatus Dactylopiibacterium sp.]